MNATSTSAVPSPWLLTNRADPSAAKVADRHYTRQSIGSRQFVQPGRCLVLRTASADALWVTSWPYAKYVRHAWAGAWICSLFRNEAPDRYRSSALVTDAVAATRAAWPDVPPLGFVTFVDPNKTRRKRDPGRCFRRAGFHVVGSTKGGRIALQLLPADMPAPQPANGHQPSLFPTTEGAAA
jgi:hypothetical protein